MRKALNFDRIVGLADGLSTPEKESLLEILAKRLSEERRAALRQDIRESEREFRAGKCRAGTPAELLREITECLGRSSAVRPS